MLGCFCLETFLRSACLEWLRQTLCSYARYLGVSTLHMFKINRFLASSSTDYQHCNFSYDPSTISSFDMPFKTLLGILGYWALLFEASSRSARLQGLHEVGPTRFLAAMLRRSGCLYSSFNQDHDSVFFSLWSIKLAMTSASMLGDYSMSASSTPSCFPRRTDLMGNPLLITLLLDLRFLLFFFFGPSYRPSCLP
jgi:hypothetical protein